jgi:uncharacterized protein YndB with AHSA1/START domain
VNESLKERDLMTLKHSLGTLIEPATLRVERTLPAPVERVWAYLVDPEKRRTWLAGGSMAAAPGGVFELRFQHTELTPKGDGTQLVLTHRRLPDRKETVSVSSGWHAHLDVLDDVLHGRKPHGFWTNLQEIEKAYEAGIP